MAWNELDEPLRGRRQELLARVVGRGERLRQRRRVAWGAAAVSAVLAVAVPAAVWRGASDSGSRVVSASGGPAAPGPSADTGATTDGTTTVPAPSDSAVPATPPPSDARPTTTTSRPAAREPSPVVPPPPQSPTPTAQAGAVEQPPRCTPADLEVNATTDKTSYGPGEVVRVSGTLRNRSSQTCTYGASLRFEVRDGAGTPVFGYGGHAHYIAGQEPRLAPEESVATFPGQWDQQICAGMNGCTPAPPGVYTIVFDVHYASVTIPVTIRPD